MADNTYRIGGTLQLTVDGTQYAVRGSVEVAPSTVKREGIAGQDFVHGFTETPIVPSIKADLSTVPNLLISSLEQGITNSTIQATLANGRSYILTQAWTTSSFVINAAEGRVAVEFQGITINEI